MKFENTEVMNFGGAFRGMRNPKNSWDRSDSVFGIVDVERDPEPSYDVVEDWLKKKYPELSEKTDSNKYYEAIEEIDNWLYRNGVVRYDDTTECGEYAFIGPKDMQLAQTLIKAGPEHRKFLRQIFVSVDITAPLYLWKELDTYKVATTTNSTSTMHKLTSKPITLDCFETDDYDPALKIEHLDGPVTNIEFSNTVNHIIEFCEKLRLLYLQTKNERYWKELIRWLPESWLQTRTWTCNYETLRSIYHQRKNHKLNEWSGIHTEVDNYFIKWIENLPYANELIMI